MKKHSLLKEKHSGILIPLFSMKSKDDWGAGDISSFEKWLDLLAACNIDIVEILPINDLAPGVNCPYTALSGFALDPVYAAVDKIEELNDRPETLERLRKKYAAEKERNKNLGYIPYDEIKKVKYDFLWNGYDLFLENHSGKNPEREKEFSHFAEANAYWLDDYALFRAAKDRTGWFSWTHWEPGLKNRDKDFLEKFSRENEKRVNFFKYCQWTLDRQWKRLKEKAEKLNVKIYGDLPFMPNRESADIWSRPGEFDINASIGAPPDAFSANGQNWGLPACDWREMEKNGFEWWRLKVRRAGDLYHMYRLDHMVGFFRTWIIFPNEKPRFDISGEREQIERGRRFLSSMLSAGPLLPVAEDLGLIPPYVGKVLKEKNVPGYKVMRWEKDEKSGEYIPPENYEPVSLATTSTHDNETLNEWWNSVEKKEKKLFWKMVSGSSGRPPSFEKAHEKIIEKIFKAASKLAVLPIQDILGTGERINLPNTMGVRNWSYGPDFSIEEISSAERKKFEKTKKIIARERK